MPVLYRKYRPQTFEDVVGQPHITRTLANAIAAGRVAHAYLFSGPRGVGKTTTARLLAKAVNCERGTKKKDGVPCNACDLCAEITEGRCLDVVELDAASHTQVDTVRSEIIEKVRIAPSRARRKVYIIDEVHMLSSASFNALLKTLEEPPGHALFILATTELHKVPETIRSRCQQFAFRRVARADLEARIHDLAKREGATVDPEVAASIARATDGSVRDAESMLGQLLALGGAHIGTEEAASTLPRSSVARAAALVAAMERADSAAALAEVRVAEDEGFDAEAYVRDVIAVLRDAIIAEINDASRVAGRVAALQIFMELLETIGRSDHPFFSLEIAALRVTAGGGGSGKKVERHAQEGAVAPPRAADIAREERSQPTAEQAVEIVARARAHHDAAPSNNPATCDEAGALERIRAAWSSLIVKLATANHSLPYLLEGGRPQRVADGVLTIGFRYKLHAEKVRQPEASSAVADALSALLGTSFRVATAVISAEEFQQLDAVSRPQTGDAVADAALEVFGGRVVE